jgi:hypothetical protein
MFLDEYQLSNRVVLSCKCWRTYLVPDIYLDILNL